MVGSIMLGIYILFIHKDKSKLKPDDTVSEVGEADGTDKAEDTVNAEAAAADEEKPENEDTEK